MDGTQLLEFFSSGLKTNPGQLITALVIVVFVGWAKNAPWLRDLLTTVARKRLFALVMSVLPVFGIILWQTMSWIEATAAGLVAFLSATGLNRIIPDSNKNPDPVAVGEAVNKILEEKQDLLPVVVEEKKPEETKP